ncbi:MAG: hypothetical protein ISR65_02655 [Bacteriovoracaceae bacterium]|nr:hypothetical protein [Bacteriovoracaceae bacterium]
MAKQVRLLKCKIGKPFSEITTRYAVVRPSSLPDMVTRYGIMPMPPRPSSNTVKVGRTYNIECENVFTRDTYSDEE